MSFLIRGIPDNSAIRQFNFDLPPGSSVYADAEYTYYRLEGDLQENCDIFFRPARAKNSRRPWPGWIVYLQQHYRRYIETVGSIINVMFPKRIHAVTAEGFELKLLLFIVAYTFEVT